MNARELRLAIALAAIVLLGGGYMAYKKLGKWKMSLESREMTVAQRRTEAEALLSMKDFWQARSEFLNANQPEYKNRNEADNMLLSFVKDLAKANEVELTLAQLEQPEDQPGVRAANMVVDGKADYEKMWRFLHALQEEPKNFITVRGLELRPNLEDTKVLEVTELRIQKWFKATSTEGQ
jgi:hypothetical protein